MASAIEPLLKVRYGEFINPLPSENTIAKDVPFVPSEMRSGRSYNFPVNLTLPHGVKHDDTMTAFALATVIPSVKKEATLTGASIVIRDNVSWDDVFATMNGVANGGGAGGAYMSVWDDCTRGLMQSGELYREIALLYGPGNTSTAAATLGVVEANELSSDLDPSATLSITRATWAPGLWPNMIGALVDIYETDGATPRATGVTVLSVDESQNRVELFKSGSSVTPAAGDVLLASTAIDVSCYGMEAIAANTGSLFGISASTYPQWKVTGYAVDSHAIERSDVLAMCSRQVAHGVTGGATLYLCPHAIGDLIEEANELQQFIGDPDEVRVQSSSAVSYKTQIGRVDVKPHPYMKQGIGFLVPKKDGAKRVGSTDLTFRGDGKGDEWFYTTLADNAGSQLRIMSSQAIVFPKPWQVTYVTGIQSSADTLPS